MLSDGIGIGIGVETGVGGGGGGGGGLGGDTVVDVDPPLDAELPLVVDGAELSPPPTLPVLLPELPLPEALLPVELPLAAPLPPTALPPVVAPLAADVPLSVSLPPPALPLVASPPVDPPLAPAALPPVVPPLPPEPPLPPDDAPPVLLAPVTPFLVLLSPLASVPDESTAQFVELPTGAPSESMSRCALSKLQETDWPKNRTAVRTIIATSRSTTTYSDMPWPRWPSRFAVIDTAILLALFLNLSFFKIRFMQICFFCGRIKYLSEVYLFEPVSGA